jgi:hypothetical protein
VASSRDFDRTLRLPAEVFHSRTPLPDVATDHVALRDAVVASRNSTSNNLNRASVERASPASLRDQQVDATLEEDVRTRAAEIAGEQGVAKAIDCRGEAA